MDIYLVKYFNRFACVARVTSATGDYLNASIWYRNVGGGIHEGERRAFSLHEWDKAQAFADTIHPTADGMGKMENYRCPAVIAHELGWG